MESHSRLMRAFEMIEKETLHKAFTLGELVSVLGELGHGIIITLLCLIFMQPIPIPGISTPVGAMIIILATLQFLNQAPWIPKRFRSYVIPQKVLHKMAEKGHKIWGYIEKFIHPRLQFLVRYKAFHFFNLLLIIISAFLLALPLPIPFSNTVPALVILSFCFAQLEDDGLLVLVGYTLSCVMFVFFFSLGEGIMHILQRPWASFF